MFYILECTFITLCGKCTYEIFIVSYRILILLKIADRLKAHFLKLSPIQTLFVLDIVTVNVHVCVHYNR